MDKRLEDGKNIETLSHELCVLAHSVIGELAELKAITTSKCNLQKVNEKMPGTILGTMSVTKFALIDAITLAQEINHSISGKDYLQQQKEQQ